jgi:putative ABC transport system substrate-binding protein
MRRRSLLAGAGAAAGCAALGALAQPATPPKRLGCLWSGRSTDASATTGPSFGSAFRSRLRELGWNEGGNLVVVNRYTENDPGRFETAARELAAEKVDVIHAMFPAGVRAARKAAPGTPIVFSIVGDPVADGFVASLARPGGNITGASTRDTELWPKRVQLLRELLPAARRVALLADKFGPQEVPPRVEAALKNAVEVGRQLGLVVERFNISSVEEVAPAFQRLAAERFDGLLIVLYTRVTGKNRLVVTGEAERARLPGVYGSSDYVNQWGGLMSLSQNLAELARRAANYVDKILRGAKPADLPIEEPNVFELVINLKAARAIGLAIPQPILLRADRVIE